MACPTDATHELLTASLAFCESLYRPGRKYKKAGVMLAGLVLVSPLTIRMFDEERGQRLRRVSQAVDAINRNFGRETVRFAASGSDRSWIPACTKRSRRYTTRWEELLIVA